MVAIAQPCCGMVCMSSVIVCGCEVWYLWYVWCTAMVMLGLGVEVDVAIGVKCSGEGVLCVVNEIRVCCDMACTVSFRL